MPKTKTRVVVYLDDAHVEILKQAKERTGVSVCEQIRRLIIPMGSWVNYKLDQETR